MPVKIPLSLSVMLTVVLTLATSYPITMRLRSERSHVGWVHINFYGDDFYRFYSCLTNIHTRTCIAGVTRDSKHPIEADDRRVIYVLYPTLFGSPRLYSKIFACELVQQELTCSRLLANNTVCNNSKQTHFYQFFNESSSHLKCVGINFNYVNESLIYDRNVDFLHNCNTSCNFPHRKLKHNSSIDGITEEPQKHHHGTSDEYDDDVEDGDDGGEDRSHIIIASVVIISVIASLIAAGVFFRRHLSKLGKLPNELYVIGDSQSRTDINSNGAHLNKNPTEPERHADSSVPDTSTV